ncbi:hypothetical protein CKSOR_00572 [Candidatus Kinetoplastibacterium sorsogonicusi]|uniref:Outer membrane protein assembly factor BamD n=1 Tax=Candidatus Kinetoplastidibacterium kentomonadis TaxID=1576550 RepID=A0A3S7JAH6_9PROT|nr:tetratricopeptide repeat protein [Candidatus Kinetoplastibacterium sorsogonicusi]AWD32673.1 hypothetical protein CKSOR_00572 [Candidatus Kinetoplastibacterium sorsogonicusi]
MVVLDALKNFKGVIEELNNLIKLYPNHSLTADAMLIIANSQLELDLKMAAKNTLKTIIKKYPESKAALAANNRLKIL